MSKQATQVFLILASLVLSACGEQQAETPATSALVTPPKTASPPRTASPEGASVFFITPADGETVSNPLHVEFGIAGMTIVAAGVNEPQSGHHHLLIDTGLPELGLPVPADAHHIHFGDASTSTEISLEAGEHTLQLLLGDYSHIPHDPPLVSQQIAITVE